MDFLNSGVNLLIVDLFPPSPRDPQGVHAAIWEEIEAEPEPFTLPSEQPLTLVSYVVKEPMRAYVETSAVGQVMPAMPAYLDRDGYVPVPLEATHEEAWASGTDDTRDAVLDGSPPESA